MSFNCMGHPAPGLHGDRRLQAILKPPFLLEHFGFHKERKRSTKKETFGRGGLWKLPQLWKSAKKRADSHSCLENPAGFSTVTTDPTAINITSDLC